MDKVKIDGIEYKVLEARTADDMESEGYTNAARAMRKNGVVMDYYLQRPKGKVIYTACQYKSGVYSTVISLGR